MIGATEAGNVFCVNLATSEIKTSVESHRALITKYLISSRGDSFATFSEGQLRIWRMPDLTQIYADEEAPKSLGSWRYTADGRVLSWATVAYSNKLHLIHVADEHPKHQVIEVPKNVNSVTLHPDGKRLLVTNWVHLELWNLEPLELVQSLGYHDHTIRRLEFSADGKLAVSLGDDRVARIWNLETGKRVGRPIRGIDATATTVMRPDGKWLASVVPGEVLKHWHVASGRLLGSPKMELRGGSLIWKGFGRFGYSSDSQEFVSYDAENTYPFEMVPQDPQAFRLFVETWTGMMLNGNDARVLLRGQWTKRRDQLAKIAPEFVSVGGLPIASSHEKIVASVVTAKTVQIDGKLDEWKAAEELLIYPDVRESDHASARLRAMWDAEALYLSIAWRDATPLVNKVDAATRPRQGWMSDCFQGRFMIAGREYHLTAWHSSESNQSLGILEPGTALKPTKQWLFKGNGLTQRDDSGFEQAFAKDLDGRGYQQEIRLPWKLFDESFRPQSGMRLTFTGEFFWGTEAADTWPEIFWSGPTNPRIPLRKELYRNPQAWGELELGGLPVAAPKSDR